jgi:hypothetical protein
LALPFLFKLLPLRSATQQLSFQRAARAWQRGSPDGSRATSSNPSLGLWWLNWLRYIRSQEVKNVSLLLPVIFRKSEWVLSLAWTASLQDLSVAAREIGAMFLLSVGSTRI